ncbi:MarR family winged helix-turn-helix transcriptional regulator [Pimelobacter sp. 30-1]|uniref:MarR family winged helix-turn-helix transcriptional regulator n=1 Tax=Pimelobacter sp. 30-1 TaxID=2004991 RepID=UPI001C04C0D3|nr:MarR family transcriptional regulator [Pimelobacter sp. 30-1]MBU2695666.1 hypothetical protein [Pimelobacter sp. 30-1]
MSDPRGTPGAAVPVLVQELSYELNRFSHGFAHRHGLHPTDVDALAYLHQARLRGLPVTPSSLAASIELSPPATTALLHRLEASGHVVRTPDPADGRRRLLELHPSAQQLAGEFFRPLAGALRDSLDGLDPDEVAVVERWLRAASAATRSLAGTRDGATGSTRARDIPAP